MVVIPSFTKAPYNGGYLGIDFFLSVDSNIIYLSPYFPIIYNNNSSLKFEIMAKQLYVASQRVL